MGWKRWTTPKAKTKDDVAVGGGREEKDETEEKTRRRNVLVATTCVVTVGAGALRAAGAKAQPVNVYDFTVSQYGKMVSLGKYRGKVTVIVNVASE